MEEEGEETSVLGGGGETEVVEEEAADETVAEDLPAWLNDIDEEYRGEKSLHALKDINAVAKSYVHAQKLIGKDKIALPDADSSQEQINDFYTKMGKPSEEEYALDSIVNEDDSPVFNEETMKELTKVAFENNLMPQQASALMEALGNVRVEEDARLEEEANKAITDGLDDLVKEWGEEGFKANAHKANSVLDEFGFEGLTEYLKDAGLDNDPMLIRLLANIGGSLNEDTFQRETVAHLGLTKQEAQDKLNKIMGNMDSPYFNANHGEHASERAKVNKLFEVLAK